MRHLGLRERLPDLAAEGNDSIAALCEERDDSNLTVGEL